MTKQELEAENRRLAGENAGLRDLLASVSEIARSVPMADHDHHKELRRAALTLCTIKAATTPDGSWAWGWASGHAAAFLRKEAAEPVAYEVYAEQPAVAVEPEPETVPWPTGFCGHQVAPDAWTLGFTFCRDCTIAPALYDRVAAGGGS